jgi:hypothetical protein
MTTQVDAERPAELDDALAYGQTLATALAAHQSALGGVGQLLVQMEEAPSRLEDDAWKTSMATALGELEAAGAALRDLAAPSETLPEPAVYSLRRAHKLVQEVGETTRTLAASWQRGVETGDAAAIQQPRPYLHHIARAGRRALREMERAKTTTPRARRLH